MDFSKSILLLLAFFVKSLAVGTVSKTASATGDCSELSSFHIKCLPLEIDPSTQQSSSCQPNGSSFVWCHAAPGVICHGLEKNGTFRRELPNSCDYNAHLHHSTALLLSIFLGFFGIDRFYLGYYAIGVVKLFSLGGLLIIYLIDVIFIALKILGPADGSAYILPYYGAHSSRMMCNNDTYVSMLLYTI